METIEKHLLDKGSPASAAKKISQKIAACPDIAAECIYAIKRGSIPDDTKLSVEGYTARQIQDLAPFMDIVGIYAFLTDLRHQPTRAKESIARGFPRK